MLPYSALAILFLTVVSKPGHACHLYLYFHNYFMGSREKVDVRRSPREHLKCDTSKIIKKFHPHYLLCFNNARSIEKCHIWNDGCHQGRRGLLRALGPSFPVAEPLPRSHYQICFGAWATVSTHVPAAVPASLEHHILRALGTPVGIYIYIYP